MKSLRLKMINRRALLFFITLIILFSLSSISLAEDSKVNSLKILNQSQNYFNSQQYFTNFIELPKNAVGEVISTNADNLKRNLLVGGAVLGSGYFLDQNIRDHVQDNLYAGETDFSKFLYEFGDPEKILSFYAGGYLWSKISSDQYLEHTLYYSFQSLLITQGFTELFKKTVNRDRPRDSKDDPFSFTGGDSFISGHSSGAWASMTVLAKRHPQTKYLSYGMASLVSASRIYEDAHWFSDILAGSVVGYGIGSLTVKLNNALPRNISLEPLIGKDIVGTALSVSF